MLGVPRVFTRIVLVVLITLIVQGREPILPHGNLRGLISDLVHRCHGRASLETLFLHTEGTVTPLIVVVRENLPFLLPAGLMDPVMHEF